MLFNSIFRNINVTLVCITKKEEFSFGAGGEWGTRTLFLNFLDPPLNTVSIYQVTVIFAGILKGCSQVLLSYRLRLKLHILNYNLMDIMMPLETM